MVDPTPHFSPPPPQPACASDRKQTIVALVVLVVVFGVILPQLIDYEVVWDTLTGLDPWVFLVLLAAGFIYYIPEGWLYALVVPGMTL